MLVRPYGREWARGITHGLLFDCPSLARQAQGTAIALFYVVVYMRFITWVLIRLHLRFTKNRPKQNGI